MFKRRGGEIVKVKDLFEKYRTLLKAPQKTVELESIRVIGELTNIKLLEHQVGYTVSTRTLVIQASSMLKQEVKIHNRAVLKELKVRLGEKSSPEHIL
jgi:hypothetical protein